MTHSQPKSTARIVSRLHDAEENKHFVNDEDKPAQKSQTEQGDKDKPRISELLSAGKIFVKIVKTFISHVIPFCRVAANGARDKRSVGRLECSYCSKS